MSATELDLPVLITSEQIRRREFVTTRRGYDPHQVRDYLEGLADQVDLMAAMIRDARMEAEALMDDGTTPDPYERLARRVTGVIRAADETAERFRIEARRDAEAVLDEARADAERIREDARAAAEEARRSAERALAEARDRADTTIAGLTSRRDALVDQLGGMRDRLLAVAAELEATVVAPPPAPPLPADEDLAALAEAVTAPAGVEPREADPQPDAPPPHGSVRIVDVRSASGAAPPQGDPITIEALFADLDDGAQEELWEDADVDRLEVPEIPPLDLDWGPDLDDEDPR